MILLSSATTAETHGSCRNYLA